jgi:hypothetical protein
MSNKTDTATAGSDKYFLEDWERWESLGFDWQGWNATIAKILQQKAAANSEMQQENSGEGIPG